MLYFARRIVESGEKTSQHDDEDKGKILTLQRVRTSLMVQCCAIGNVALGIETFVITNPVSHTGRFLYENKSPPETKIIGFLICINDMHKEVYLS